MQVGPQSPFIVARSGRRVPAGTPSAEPPTCAFPPPRSGRFGERIPLSTQRRPDAPSPRREAPHSAAAAPRARPPAATSCRPPPRLCPPGTLPVRSRRPGRSTELPVPGPPVWRVSHAPVLLRAEQYSIARCASSICPGRGGFVATFWPLGAGAAANIWAPAVDEHLFQVPRVHLALEATGHLLTQLTELLPEASELKKPSDDLSRQRTRASGRLQDPGGGVLRCLPQPAVGYPGAEEEPARRALGGQSWGLAPLPGLGSQGGEQAPNAQ